MPDDGLSCGNDVPFSRCRFSSAAARLAAVLLSGMYLAASRPLSSAPSRLRRILRASSLSNIVMTCSFNCFFETWMISRPFYIEDAPDLAGLDSKIDGSHVTHRWLPFQSIEVLRLGPFAFTEDQKCLFGLASCDATFERPPLRPLTFPSDHVSLDSKPKARRKTNWSSSGTAPNLPWR